MSDEASAQTSELETWAANQRALARALGLSLEEWLRELEAASGRKTGLTAAVVGAAMAEGLGLSVLERVDGPALAAHARGLIDPRPPRTDNPVLMEAIRRSGELTEGLGQGARRLKKRDKPSIPRPERSSEIQNAPSAHEKTADAPGEDE